MNHALIEQIALEESSTVDYYVECALFLDDFIAKRPKLAGAEVCRALASLKRELLADPGVRSFDSLAAIQSLVAPFVEDGHPSLEPAASAAGALLLFGMAGKSLYFLSKQHHSRQFEKELSRLFESMSGVRANIWLFHVSAQLAQAGFRIEFVPERAGPTPDFLAARGDVRVFVEANARSPERRDIIGIKDVLWNVMHGDARSGSKQTKFRDPHFDPGLIVVDISNCDVSGNDTGLPPNVKLRADALVVNNQSGRIYDIAADPEFFDQPENTGNVVEWAVRYFHQMAAGDKYHVRALLLGISMGLRTVTAGVLGAPKGALMVVDSRYRQLALCELARQIYLVDTQSPLPSGRPAGPPRSMQRY